MTERSYPWGGTAVGDAGGYSHQDWNKAWRYLLSVDFATQCVLPGYGGQLAASNATSPVSISTGAALVHGTFYENDANASVVIPTPVSSTRIDRIVLRKDHVNQTVRITRIAGTEGGGAPAIVQNESTYWDVPIWQASITTLGAITLTDDRKIVPLSGNMVGEIKMWASNNLPSGWGWCDGAAISRTTYSMLFAEIGTSYGVGDGNTTFNKPDLRGRVGVGQDDMGGSAASRVTGVHGNQGDDLGDAGGSQEHTLIAGEVPAHTHDEYGHDFDGSGSGGSAYRLTGTHDVNWGTEKVAQNDTSSFGGSGAHTNMQPYQVVNYIIFTGVYT